MLALIRVLALVALLLGFTPGIRAQFEKPNPTQLIVRVCLDSYQNSAPANLTVQLRDGLGMLEYERHTDTRGVVEFSTITTRKQLRIYGPGIVEHEESFDIEPVEAHKTVIVIVKTDAKNPSPRLPAGTIPSSRLLVPDKAQKEFQKGSEALAKKNWVDAKTHFDSAIAIYPDYDVAHNGLGMSLASAGDSKAARPAFEEAYRNLARISLSERNFEEMNNLLTRSLSADPLNAWALAYAAYSELQLHKFAEALEHAQKTHTVEHKGLASAHTVAALALEALNRQPEAISEYELYLQEDPNGRDAARAKDKIARLKTGNEPQ